ncbi:MAG: hypothetical protein AB7O96_15230 [Pseudobdellovibrionaceae bacterium]
MAQVEEQNLQRMESLLAQSAQGIHILFDNPSLKKVLSRPTNDKDFFDFNKMKKVQDMMTTLIAKPSYFEKLAFLRDLDLENYELLVRTYFHIVENTVRASQDHKH